MNVAICYRSATVWNIILFTFLIFFFLFFQEGLLQARSVFESDFLQVIASKYLVYNILLGFCALAVFRLKRYAKGLFLLCTVLAVAFTISNLIGNFSKLIVITLFLYVLTSYYFYQFLCIEIDEAYYNPQYQEDDLFEPMLKKLDCVVWDIKGNNALKARLTNWNPNGCFLYFEEKVEGARMRHVRLEVELDGRPFVATGTLAAKAGDGKGFGFRLKNKEADEFGWRDYYSIIDQMGYNVELLK